MLPRQVQRKLKSFALQRGLYVVRYDTAADLTQPPLVTFTCTPGVNEIIAPPDQPTATMSQPGNALVIRALATGNVQVEISSTGPAVVLDATLKFEQLRGDAGTSSGTAPTPSVGTPQLPPLVGGRSSQSLPPLPELGAALPMPRMDAPASWPTFQPPQATIAPDTGAGAALQLVGHLARVGDVTVGQNEWLGGPSSPTRIEGILLKWANKPADLNVQYSTVVAGQRPAEVRTVEVGEYSGTRGRGRPVLGFAMELTGAAARYHTIVAETVFLGAPAKRVSGTSVSATGPTGRETLVGLRLAIVAQSAERPAVPPAMVPGVMQQPLVANAAPQQSVAAPAAAPAQPRVRVFRA